MLPSRKEPRHRCLDLQSLPLVSLPRNQRAQEPEGSDSYGQHPRDTDRRRGAGGGWRRAEGKQTTNTRPQSVPGNRVSLGVWGEGWLPASLMYQLWPWA